MKEAWEIQSFRAGRPRVMRIPRKLQSSPLSVIPYFSSISFLNDWSSARSEEAMIWSSTWRAMRMRAPFRTRR
jgi:hypothetical protein